MKEERWFQSSKEIRLDEEAVNGSVEGLSFSWAYLKASQCYNQGGVCFFMIRW